MMIINKQDEVSTDEKNKCSHLSRPDGIISIFLTRHATSGICVRFWT